MITIMPNTAAMIMFCGGEFPGGCVEISRLSDASFSVAGLFGIVVVAGELMDEKCVAKDDGTDIDEGLLGVIPEFEGSDSGAVK